MEATLNRKTVFRLIIRLQDAYNITVPKCSNFQKAICSKLVCVGDPTCVVKRSGRFWMRISKMSAFEIILKQYTSTSKTSLIVFWVAYTLRGCIKWRKWPKSYHWTFFSEKSVVRFSKKILNFLKFLLNKKGNIVTLIFSNRLERYCWSGRAGPSLESSAHGLLC